MNAHIRPHRTGRRVLFGGLLASLFASLLLAASARTDVATGLDWIATMHVARHDALNAIEPLLDASTRAGARVRTDPVAAAAAAAHHVLRTIFSDQVGTRDARPGWKDLLVAYEAGWDLGRKSVEWVIARMLADR